MLFAAKEPKEHTSQASLSWLYTDPGGQASSGSLHKLTDVAPGVMVTVPMGHGVHTEEEVDPATEEYVCRGQRTQDARVLAPVTPE